VRFELMHSSTCPDGAATLHREPFAYVWQTKVIGQSPSTKAVDKIFQTSFAESQKGVKTKSDVPKPRSRRGTKHAIEIAKN